jgi:hypothetical protein
MAAADFVSLEDLQGSSDTDRLDDPELAAQLGNCTLVTWLAVTWLAVWGLAVWGRRGIVLPLQNANWCCFCCY